MDPAPQLPIRDETWQTLRRLVASGTTSRRSNLGLIAWAHDRLAAPGARAQLAPCEAFMDGLCEELAKD